MASFLGEGEEVKGRRKERRKDGRRGGIKKRKAEEGSIQEKQER